MEASLAIIGGTGLDQLPGLVIERREVVSTPFGPPAAALTYGYFERDDRIPIVFLPRHGDEHALPPHKINYRANIWALRDAGIKSLLAVAAVGGIAHEMVPARLAFPTQLIDYTYGREHTFFDCHLSEAVHVDFSAPYDPKLHEMALASAASLALDYVPSGVYGATQGPRLETVAEIARMAGDGCDLVGMTGMPEAVLARELGLGYLCIAVIVNWAAGKDPVHKTISHDDIRSNLSAGMAQVQRLLPDLLTRAHGA